MRQTLPKTFILRGYQSFTQVISTGTPHYGGMLTAFVVTDAADTRLMIGFSVPKKQVRLAVRRNRIKRLMREAVRRDRSPLSAALEQRSLGARIVLMFRRQPQQDPARLSLGDIEPVWNELQQRIVNAL